MISMRKLVFGLLFCLQLFGLRSGLSAGEFDWKAGTARSVITPKKQLWMAGYGARTAPAEGKQHDLLIRALALEDAGRHRAVILSSDLLGIPKSIYETVCQQVKARFNLDRSQIMLHASHTHCGPVLKSSLQDIYPLNEQQLADVSEYSEWLTGEIVRTIGAAIDNLQPATVSRGMGTTDFAVNRRTNREPDVPALREQNLLVGPVDHTTPTLAVFNSKGQLKAMVFTYACHNTTLSYQQWCGDYAGFAQFELEEKYPGATAMFCMGCGADQNPLPRRTLENCQKYGSQLAQAVAKTLSQPMTPVRSKLETRHAFVTLVMDPMPPVAKLEKMSSEPASYTQRWAKRLLEEINAGKKHELEYDYPIQAWRLGGDQLWITLGGEVVVDYALRLKAEFGDQTWVSGYVNDVMAYIPSRRVLLEGGYEGQSSMMVYGMPSERWAQDVEERLVTGVEKVVKSLDQ